MIIRKEFIDAFISTGLRPHEAKVLIYLLEHKHGQSRDIERTMDLRQPEVCTALSSLQKQGWVKKTKTPRMTQGRPLFNYSLSKKPLTIISELKNLNEKKISELEKIKNKLQEVEEDVKKKN